MEKKLEDLDRVVIKQAVEITELQVKIKKLQVLVQHFVYPYAEEDTQ